MDQTALSGSTFGQVVLVILSLISTAAMLWKTSRDQTHALELIRLNHEVDAANRIQQAAIDKADRELVAAALRERLLTDAAAVQTQLHASANAIRDRVEQVAVRTDVAKAETRVETKEALAAQTAELRAESKDALAAQTAELRAAIEAAKVYTAEKADAAYDEANDVNQKLKKLHEAHAEQAAVLRNLVAVLSLNDRVGPIPPTDGGHA